MVLDASIGFGIKRYIGSGERGVVLQGRAYKYSGSPGDGVQRGNAMSEIVGTAYQVPAGKTFRALAYKIQVWEPGTASWGQYGERGYLPIGTGTDPTNTASYTKVDQLDVFPERTMEDSSGVLRISGGFTGDCDFKIEAAAYPKVGTMGRHNASDSPISETDAHVQLYGVEG